MLDCLRQFCEIAQHYERLSKRLASEAAALPAGSFLVRQNRNRERYYHQFREAGKTRQVYLNKEKAAELQPLLDRKKKIRRFLRAWRCSQRLIKPMERLAAQILVQEELVSALAALYTAPQEPVQGAVKKLPPQIRLYRQPQRFYEIRNTPPPHPQRRTMLTASGEKVRSKSEVILADRLAGNGLEYYYEPGILLGEQVFHPDFLIRLPGREDFVLWEHRGLTEAAYLQSWNEKILLYRDQGILEGSNLFVSYDTADGGLDSYGIQRRIEAFLFPSGVFSETA